MVVAHGERRAGAANRTLLAHVEMLRLALPDVLVIAGVLKGEPALEMALEKAQSEGVDRLVVYPFLMSDGYFVANVLPTRITASAFRGEVSLLPPLGRDPRFPAFVLERALATAQEAGLEPSRTSLIVVGHGSSRSDASARATSAVAERVAAGSTFASVSTAFLEEPPFLGSELAAQPRPTVVAGLFSGEGRHGWHDIPAIIEESGARAVYAGPVGAHPGVIELILQAVRVVTG